MNPYRLIADDGTWLHVAEDKINLFSQPAQLYPQFQITKTLVPYTQLYKMTLDIETTGLNPEFDTVKSIGMLDSDGTYYVKSGHNERELLDWFSHTIKSKCPDVIYTHNGTKFDFPFLLTRARHHDGIVLPFYIDSYQVVISNSNWYGQPIIINPIKCFNKSTAVIDTMIAACQWDFVNARLNSGYGLKNVVIELGLRDSRRVELSYQQMLECYEKNNWTLLEDYLRFDLQDTMLIADFLMPQVYYQMAIVPGLSFDELAVKGMGGKWTKIIRALLPESKKYPEPDTPRKFEGGYTQSTPGLHISAAKVDVASLYPSIMLNYGIWTHKDPNQYGLGVLKFLTEERLKLKHSKEPGEKALSDSMKVLINSGYGALGTKGAFNDYKAAALVTAYGRAIVKLMAKVIESHGGKIAEIDTDGIIFTSEEPSELHKTLQKAMPKGINVELEEEYQAVYVPQRGTKNYILFLPNGDVKGKGVWRKRDRAKLEFLFVKEYLQLFMEHPSRAEAYYQSTLREINENCLDIGLIRQRRKIAKGNKSMLHLGNPGEYVNCYKTEEARFHKRTGKAIKPAYIETDSAPYSISYYTKLITKLRDGILKALSGEDSELAND